MPTQVTSEEILAAIMTLPENQIFGLTHTRKGDKWEKRCPIIIDRIRDVRCSALVQRHESEWICPNCEIAVRPYRRCVARAGDLTSDTYKRRINGRDGTKHWTPARGILYNAATQADADRIRIKSRSIQLCKMGGDRKYSEPRTIDYRTIVAATIDSVRYIVVNPVAVNA